MHGRAIPCVVALLLALAGCGPGEETDVDPAATYEALGQAFEPAPALPVEAALAEPELHLDRAVMVEGVLRDACRREGCWMVMEADTARLEILQPDFEVAGSYAGRRAVAHGVLAAGDAGVFTLKPTGVMVEKVRS